MIPSLPPDESIRPLEASVISKRTSPGEFDRIVALGAAVDSALDKLLRGRARSTATQTQSDAALEAELNTALRSMRAELSLVPLGSDEDRKWFLYSTGEKLRAVAELLKASDRGDLWSAARYAISVGTLSDLGRIVTSLGPNARVGATMRQKGRAGGLAPKELRGTSPATLIAEVLEMHKKHPKLSWTMVCARVGAAQEPPLAGRTVQRRTRTVKWPPWRRG